jgi:histone H3/H4
MAVTHWSGEAMAELKSLEQSMPRRMMGWIRQRAQQLAAEAGRRQVERIDLCEALGRYYDEHGGG